MRSVETSLADRLSRIEDKGSTALQAHVQEDNSRIGDIKNTLATLVAVPGRLEAVNARLDNLKEGQQRIEETLKDAHKVFGNKTVQ
jgi:hypothetical protein